MIFGHFDEQLCRQCRGLCCQGHPGVYADPERFRQTFFSSGLLSKSQLTLHLPYWGMELKDLGGVEVPAPRTAHWGCVFLGPQGCRLAIDRRPCQCLALTPSLDTLIQGDIQCQMPPAYGHGAARNRWRAFWANFGS